MPDRRKQIELLLGSLYDGIYFPPGPLARSTRGLVPTERVPCPDCGHSESPGWRVDSFKRRTPCVTCGGELATETTKARKGKGVIAVDPMDAQRAAVGSADTSASARPVRVVKCDACAGEGAHGNGDRCGYCQGSGRRPLHVFNLQLDTRRNDDIDLDAVTRAIDQRNQSGSYAELELALSGLVRHVNKPDPFAWLRDERRALWARRLLEEVYVTQVRDAEALSPLEVALVDTALAYVNARMPDPIRVPSGVAFADKQRRDHRTRARGRWAGPALKVRDKEIRGHAKSGRSPQWIAREYGLSVSAVYEVVNGSKEGVA